MSPLVMWTVPSDYIMFCDLVTVQCESELSDSCSYKCLNLNAMVMKAVSELWCGHNDL